MQDDQRSAQHERLERALALPALTGYVNNLIERVAELLSRRTPTELQAIAAHTDNVIHAHFEKLAKSGFGPTVTKEMMGLDRVARLAYADVDLWLASGAQDRKPPRGSGVPADVTRAEYLATIAIWKASYLGDLTSDLTDEIRRASAGARLPARRDLKDDPIIHLTAHIFEIERLTMEITQAATLAMEASYFEKELAKARRAGAVEREKALLHAQNIHVRAAGAKGGAARAAKYHPAKARAIELYKAGAGAGNRSAATREILKVLEEEGLPAKYEFIWRTLSAHDDDIARRRRSAPKGGA